MENIVYVATPHDWFDYLATGTTLLLSVIAVIIAVSTARRQNKIALFEKRDTTYCYVRALYYSTKAIISVLSDSGFEGTDSIYRHVIETRYDATFTNTPLQYRDKIDYLYISQLIQYSDKENLSRVKRLFRINKKSIEVINHFIIHDSFLLRSITSETTGVKSDISLEEELVVVKAFLEKHDFEDVLNKLARQTTMNSKSRLRKSEL